MNKISEREKKIAKAAFEAGRQAAHGEDPQEKIVKSMVSAAINETAMSVAVELAKAKATKQANSSLYDSFL